MALDGAFLRHIKKELEEHIIGAKVDKVYQPMRDVIILTLRTREGMYKVLFSAQANSARVHFADKLPENPKQAPMLCMLFRKKLIGSKLLRIDQPEIERLLHFKFDAMDEMGDRSELTLTIEIMGKHSNIILWNAEGKIIDSVKHVDAEMSTKRLVLPGVKYNTPPEQEKMSILCSETSEIVEAVRGAPANGGLAKTLLNTLQGISPIISREIEFRVGRGRQLYISEMNDEQWMRLGFFCQKLKEMICDISGIPYMILDKNKKHIDFTFDNVEQYGTGAIVYKQESFSKLLDKYFFERDEAERMRTRSLDILKNLSSLSERVRRKISALEKELEVCREREWLRISGDILTANAYSMEKGMDSVVLDNYYSQDNEKIVIKLNPTLTPMQNAQKYYKEYRKAKTAQEKLTEQIKLSRDESDYLDSLFDSLTRAKTEADMLEIRTELIQQGYVKSKNKIKKKERQIGVSEPLKFTTKTGFTILVGKNNRQNDILTLKTATKGDIWFHTKNIPGSHTVIITNGEKPDVETMESAAILAAKHSRARDSAQVPVDYTLVRYVHKPTGAKPGMVIYTNQKTITVNPNDDLQIEGRGEAT